MPLAGGRWDGQSRALLPRSRRRRSSRRRSSDVGAAARGGHDRDSLVDARRAGGGGDALRSPPPPCARAVAARGRAASRAGRRRLLVDRRFAKQPSTWSQPVSYVVALLVGRPRRSRPSRGARARRASRRPRAGSGPRPRSPTASRSRMFQASTSRVRRIPGDDGRPVPLLAAARTTSYTSPPSCSSKTICCHVVAVDRVRLDRPPALRAGREDPERLLDRAVDRDGLADGLDHECLVHGAPFSSAAALKRARASSQKSSTHARSTATPAPSSVVEVPRPVPAMRDEARVLEDAEMLGDRGPAHRNLRGELADRPRAARAAARRPAGESGRRGRRAGVR